MTIRALVGLAALNGMILLAGCGLLWAIRGWRSWAELVRLSGFAYMLGVAGLGVTLTLELILGVPFSLASIVVTGGALTGAGLVTGRLLGRPRPAGWERGRERIGLVAIVYGALVIVYLEAVFRAGRLAPLSAWDAWAFWVPKAKAIYFLGGLDEQFFRELANPSYPPLLPALEASAFHFMGSADVVTLHLQLWFFLVGFVAAVAGLLVPRVHPLLLWPFVLVVLVAPRVVNRVLEPQADFLLDYLFALGALLVALWLLERRSWQLVSATAFLAAGMLTKREGQLFAACIVAAALVASLRDRRHAWPRLAVAAGSAFALALPWRIWFASRNLTSDVPTAGFLGIFDHLDRARPALESVLGAVFDPGLWLLVPLLALVALVLAFLGGARVLATYVAVVSGLAVAGFTWVLWSSPEIELPFVQDEGVNPIVRLSGSLVLLSAAMVPLLLDSAWRGSDTRSTEAGER